MNILLLFHAGDAPLAVRLLSHIRQTGGTQRHSLFLLPDDTVPASVADTAMTLAGGVFANVNMERLPTDPSITRPVFRYNNGWKEAVAFAERNNLDRFFFCEPDVFPVRQTWADEFEDAWIASGQPFSGYLEFTASRPELHQLRHMNGVGGYSSIRSLAPSLLNPPTSGTNILPADYGSIPEIVRHELLHISPIYQLENRDEVLAQPVQNWLKPETALLHSVKGDDLWKRLMETASAGTFVATHNRPCEQPQTVK